MAVETYMGMDGNAVLTVVEEISRETLEVYRTSRRRIEEDANSERRISQGGYHEHSLRELVQNGLDEMHETGDGRMTVILTDTHLYCANTGEPISPAGAETILRMGVSRKRGGQVGRFGVGVKAVLSVTDTPQFFSTTGSFGFDREWAAERITAVQPGVVEIPVLRIGRRLDEARERSDDPLLDALLKQGAATVVRLPLLPGSADRLGREIAKFTHEFPLFCPRVRDIHFEDRRHLPKTTLDIRAQRSGTHHELVVRRTGTPARASRWRVFTTTHVPSPDAHEHAGELHSRPEIEISWAVPEYERNERGILTVPGDRGWFWAYFPTTQRTTLSGYLNAPWKTSEDRGALYEDSPFNIELLQKAAGFVLDSLPRLAPAEDPGAYLALLPGRVKESPNNHDRLLVETLWRLAAEQPSLPDQDGVLRVPGEIRVHPSFGKDHQEFLRECLAIWSGYPGRPVDWVHPSVEATRDRHGKMEHILLAAHKTTARAKAWLEALVEDGTPAASIAAIRIAAAIVDRARRDTTLRELAEGVRTARIILTEKDGMVAPKATVFRRSVEDGLPDDQVYVAAAVAEAPGLPGLLDKLDIHEATAHGRFSSVLAQGFRGYTAESWARFWELCRAAGGRTVLPEVRKSVPDPAGTLHVKTVSGQFRPMNECLLPGPVVPDDGSRDAMIAVDLGFHTDDRPVLAELGLRDRPGTGCDPKEEPWFVEYRDALYDHYCSTLPDIASRPQRARMNLDGARTAGPLHLLPRLSEPGRAAFVAAMPDEGVVESWTLRFGNQGQPTQIVSPLRWLVRRHGLVKTGAGLLPIRDCVGPQLSAHAGMLPVARGVSGLKATKLGMPNTLDRVPQRMWDALLGRVGESEDDEFVGAAYALLLEAEAVIPAELPTRCRVGSEWTARPDGEIAVTADRAVYDSLVRERVPALLAPRQNDVDRMIEAWGMLPVDEVISKEIRHVPASEPKSLVDEFPPLRDVLGRGAESYQLVICSELEEITRTPNGTHAEQLESALRDERTVLLLDPGGPVETLVVADREFGWRLGRDGCRRVIEMHRQRLEDRALQDRLRAVRESESITDKLLLLIGEERLRQGLPEGLLESERQESGAEPTGQRIAELAYFAHDDAVLRHHAKDLAADLPDVPASFTGTTTAVRFVTDLGFPESFAGFRSPSLEPRLSVSGPIDFPALHDYQEKMASNLLAMLLEPTPQRRMLSLPTGAGKTRVTAEAVIRWIRRGGAKDGPVLWIAQTEELCEQAVQSWSFVWSKVGAETELTIDRLWASNEATPVSDGPQLVIATDAKLGVCLDKPEYAWLRAASLVIVDEAHLGISSRYTELLVSLDLTHRSTGRHLLGLTATPFRSSTEETRRLVQRFSSPGAPRLDEGVFEGEPYRELQKLEMLAQVEHRLLRGGTIRLNTEEQQRTAQMRMLPKSAEQRLADDHDRNGMLVQEIADVEPLGPVLLFATSVSHAKLMAAKLNSLGIRAASIDSATHAQERRNRIDAFRRGKVRVLTNYGVLTQGFDAPATRTVVVARPTYSPNTYQQMIGRGLRGPRNGGKPECLILNVKDNIDNYKENLAFTEFEYLWSQR
ncbi:DEAD/DEAH box helicase [Streptomyces aidingensis]|uniref:Superfamily II DNA or RNA helicase n=1 Tax=Streptomyces aidingensis TaxID=910347 RepID=A0A1I1TZF9_9ACTN|nr:DEAD/DEAH box helicase [Streptomyces aidingensis]SFD62748.1 Superfamily II DNA or RNA helicase [Streptomyces aidingensis]